MGRGRSDKTKAIVDLAFEVLEAEHPMTLRQLFYRLVSVQALDNRQTDYQRLSRILTDAREREEIDYEWIVDRSRPVYEVNVFRDPAAYAKAVMTSYRRNNWQDQPWHVEVWTEKDAITGAIQPVTDRLGITIRTGRGFQSTTRVHEIAECLNDINKPIEVLYLGDHDPSGRCIEEDVKQRVEAKTVEEFTLRRLAIHAKDIGKFNLPPLRVKTSDSRARTFLREHGTECVELDALPPSELRRRLTEAIEARIDWVRWDRAVRVQTAEIESIRKIAGKIANLHQAEP